MQNGPQRPPATDLNHSPGFRPFFLLSFLSIIWAYTAFAGYGSGAPLRQFYILALGVLAFAWRITADDLKDPPRLERFVVWILFLLPGSALLQALRLPLSAAVSSQPFAFFLLISSCAVVFLISRDLVFQFSEQPWIVAMPLIVVAAVEGGIWLAEMISADDTQQPRGSPGFAPLADVLSLLLPFAVMYTIVVLRRINHRRKGSGFRLKLQAGALFLIAALLLFVIFSGSVSGLAASAASLFLMAILGWRIHAAAWARYGLAGILLLATGFALISIGPERPALWVESLRLAVRFPIIGSAGASDSHNGYLQSLIDFGGAGFVIAAVFSLWVLGKALKLVSPHCEPEARFLVLACVGSLSALLLDNCLDFNLFSPANALLAAWVAGLCTGLKFARTDWHRRTFGLPSIVESRALSR